jgi:hypothetical protein
MEAAAVGTLHGHHAAVAWPQVRLASAQLAAHPRQVCGGDKSRQGSPSRVWLP